MTRHRIIIVAALFLVLAGGFLPARLIAGEPAKGAAKAKATDESAKGEMLPLDKMPVLIKQVQPVYPEQEKKDGVTGQVLLRMYVGTSGAVDSLSVAQGVEGHPAFSQSATAAAKQWLFKPGEMNGKPAGCWIMVPVQFRLN